MTSICEYGELANAVYDDRPTVNQWTCKNFHPGLGQGLQAAVFTRGQQTVVAFKGTTPTQGSDIVADLKIGTGMNTSYFSAAEEYVARFADGDGVVATGHSLGGAIAQVVGNRRRLPFVTFNAPGVALIASRNVHTASLGMSAVRVAGGLLSALRHPQQMMRDVRSAFYVVQGRNYRLSGDVVSQIGLHYGDIVSLQGSGGALEQHSMDRMLEVLKRFGYHNIEFPV